jgi:predicted ATPase
MLKSSRQQHHLRIAQVLTERFPETIQTEPELVAHHYTEAGAYEQAVVYWQLAGSRAMHRSAHVEAINHLRAGLELVATLPEGPDRTQLELTLQTMLAVPVTSIRGYAAPEAERALSRAHELSRQLGDSVHLFPVLRGLWTLQVVRGLAGSALGLAEQLYAFARSGGDSAFLIEAHYALGETHFFLGDFAVAAEHLEQGIALYDPAVHRAHAYVYGEEPGVNCRAYAAWNSWNSGYPDQAVAWMREAIRVAEESGHPFSLAIALSFAAALHQLRGEEAIVREIAERGIALSREQGFSLWLAMATMFLGWARFREGEREAGLADIERGLADWRATGANLGLAFVLGMMADAFGEMGRAEEGLAAIDEALAAVERSGERHHEPELHRLRGRLLLLQGGGALAGRFGEEAEAAFRRALAIARGQGNRSLELRAAMSLARLLGRSGRRQEARAVLADTYGWFTEGFATEDLRRARALLEELA